MLIGAELQAVLRTATRQGPRRHDLAAAKHWKIGGGTVWGWISYDPELDLIYYGTANPGPWNPEQRPGDNKWTAGIFARDPDTGEAQLVLPDQPARPVRPRRRQRARAARPARSTAQTRKVLRARRIATATLRDRPRHRRGAVGRRRSATSTRTEGVDLKTGRLIHGRGEDAAAGQGRARHLPGRAGREGLAAVAPSRRAPGCSTSRTRTCAWTAKAMAGQLHRRHAVRRREREDVQAGPGRQPRRVHRLGSGRGASRSGRSRRTSRSGAAPWSTAGDVVFYGTMDGWFKAVDAKTGEVLWQFKTGSGIIGQPVTYRGPDGKQYVAVLSGVGGWAGAIVSRRARSARRDGRQRLGRVRWRICKQTTTRGGMLYVFSLRRRRMTRRLARRVPCVRRSAARRLAIGVPPDARARAARLRRSRTTCRSRTSAAKGSRTGSRSCSRATRARSCDTPGGRSAAASSATRSRPARATSSWACRASFERGAHDAALLSLELRLRGRGGPRLDAALARRSAAAHAADRRADDRRRRHQHAAGARAGATAASSRNVVGYTVYGDYAQPNPPAAIVDAVDAATSTRRVVWGPLARLLRPRASAARR